MWRAWFISVCFYIMYRNSVLSGSPSGFRPDKTRAASFLNGFKNIPEKACSQ